MWRLATLFSQMRPSLEASECAGDDLVSQLRACREELKKFINEQNCAPILIRLAWHDSGTYDQRISEFPQRGGANGAIRFEPEMTMGANAGLDKAKRYLDAFAKKYPLISWADLIQLASATAVEVTGGPVIDMVYGRVAVAGPQDCVGATSREGFGGNAGLPDALPPFGCGAATPAEHLRNVFTKKMGFNDQEIVALSGAHTVGRAFKERSGACPFGYGDASASKHTKSTCTVRKDNAAGVGMAGGCPWTKNWLTFDNSYFSRYKDAMADDNLLWFPTDEALHTDPGLFRMFGGLSGHRLAQDWGMRAIKSVLVVAGGADATLSEQAVLMRSLRDTNVAKIEGDDLKIFMGLLADLFPGIDVPRARDYEMEEVLVDVMQNDYGYTHDPDGYLLLKITQLIELLGIRHCVFLMGNPGSFKSAMWKILKNAKTRRGEKTTVVDFSPKAISTNELYGFVNMQTREWKDGIISKVMRDLGQIPDSHPKWIMLDGDLDANWIESMNSVMDDNRLLTLPSNERIPLKVHMKMIFEIRDLNYATPATATRAGIVCMDDTFGVQWRSYVKSWIKKQEHPDNVKEQLWTFFERCGASTTL
ncbi:ODA11 [Symbiodinium natans]|uniref:ODA11 protein n=1 Tax=Symbiodinium natans TaxID=878477 RepID=A0A812QXZ7_9DINO|nr:ODA11 [Symbiodinium natans]